MIIHESDASISDIPMIMRCVSFLNFTRNVKRILNSDMYFIILSVLCDYLNDDKI